MNPIIESLEKLGIDRKRLKACLDGHDNWGKMVHAFEYLTVCSVVLDAMEKESSPKTTKGINQRTI